MQEASDQPPRHSMRRRLAAIVAVDDNDAKAARRAIRGAPAWPQSSVFYAFHAEIEQQIARIEAIKQS